MRTNPARRRIERTRPVTRLRPPPRPPASPSESSLPIRLEDTDIVELLQASLAPLVAQAARSSIDLRVATLGDIPHLRVDREKIAWAVTALVGNALRYVAHADAGAELGGSVLVHVTRDPGEDHVEISVQDDGPGIPADKIPFLFERRTGAVHTDGLALSLVRQIIAAHGGLIDVESLRDEQVHGTSITITLPLG